MRVHKEDIVTEYTFKVDAETLSTYMLWHLRMGYLGIQNLQKMSKMVTGLENVHFTNVTSGVCEGCMFGRQCRLLFRKSDTVRDLMELVHSDLLGPIRVLSIARLRYVLIFIEGKSHFLKCYYLKTKEGNVVLQKFKEYKAWAENVIGKRIKILRTDRGGEYVNNTMSKYLEECGIEHQRTVPYTPQQNGVSERFNRTAMEKTRAILHGGNLPLRLWAEVFDTVRYLYTLRPVKGITDEMTPEAIFYKYRDGERTSVKHLRVIGCTAYVHIPDKLRTKLDAKSKKYILVGYGTLQKGYRVWDPIRDTVTVSKDIIFDETKIGLEGNNECDRRPLLEDITELEFEIERIVKERIYNGEHEYYVKWVGYSDSENTWESYENMRDTKALDE